MMGRFPDGPAVLVALLSDIHSNLEALDACLAHARERGVDRYAFLGDFVGYGADPVGVVETVARHVDEGALAVKGNHDEAIEGSAAYLNDSAAEAIEWTRGELGGSHVAFLTALPFCLRDDASCFVHATANQPERWSYVDSPAAAQKSMQAAGTPYTFSGHVHEQQLFFLDPAGRATAFRPTPGTPVPVRRHRRWLALVGSVGQPRDRNPAAAYAVMDAAREVLTFHRVPYDNFRAARKVREAGLPESLAFRLEKGI
jgi:diadenosine tetraphosphatase ApaH/serine/threonine PP2A family protein phosphatase